MTDPVTGLCQLCGDNAALPDEEWCPDCVGEVELAFEAVTDPEHPRHHELMADISDARDGTEGLA